MFKESNTTENKKVKISKKNAIFRPASPLKGADWFYSFFFICRAILMKLHSNMDFFVLISNLQLDFLKVDYFMA